MLYRSWFLHIPRGSFPAALPYGTPSGTSPRYFLPRVRLTRVGPTSEFSFGTPRRPMSSTRISLPALIFFLIAMPASLAAQDATGCIRGTVFDATGSRISQASIAILNIATGLRSTATSDAEGGFAFELLPPGDYSARVVAEGMSPQITPQLHVDVGGSDESRISPHHRRRQGKRHRLRRTHPG